MGGTREQDILWHMVVEVVLLLLLPVNDTIPTCCGWRLGGFDWLMWPGNRVMTFLAIVHHHKNQLEPPIFRQHINWLSRWLSRLISIGQMTLADAVRKKTCSLYRNQVSLTGMNCLLCALSTFNKLPAAYQQPLPLSQTFCNPLPADNMHIAFGLQQQRFAVG